MTSLPIKVPPKNLQMTSVSHPSISSDGRFPVRDRLLTNNSPDLSGINLDGPYHSVTEYLDVHYDLLSEDFFGPVRKCVNDLKQQGRFDSSFPARMFKEVKLTPVSNERLQGKYWYVNCVLHLRETDITESMFGSLLLFMRGDIVDNIFLGKVISQKTEGGNVVIEIELKLPANHNINHEVPCINELCCSYFTMIKEDEFYYKYLHVLKVLNSLNEQSFPMKKYIVYGTRDTQVSHPAYLSASTLYRIFPMDLAPVLDSQKWPSCEMLNMDESQFSALKAALSEELAVIHGAAGTGKTYFGVKLVKVLADNITTWNAENCTPILVVCQSNQALDHFMENLLKFNIDNIARIGSECQSGLVMPYSLKELVCKQYFTTSRSTSILKSIDTIRQKIKERHPRCNTTSLREELKELENNFLDFWNKLPKKSKFSYSLRVLKSKVVVGLTSTAAAAHRQYLEELRAPIVIIEEAGEMLEAHTIVSMTEHCRHLILLGDLKQIKPMVNKFELGRDYNLNVSLFERLLTKEIVEGHCLTTQYRMRPEISSLLPDIYKVLNDSPLTLQRPNVRGLTKDVFFLHHRQEELQVENQGFWNPHEVHMLINLAYYLVNCQKYPCSDIAIITMYGEQKKKIIEVIENSYPDLLDVEVATVDSYQGRENEIVLLSLVRSNRGNDIGFLREENRIYVALSRARTGLFIMGNMHCLKRNDTWNEVRRCLERNGRIGPALPLQCEEHQTSRQVSTNGDWASFKFCPSCSCETTKIGDTFDKSVIVEMPSDDLRHYPKRAIQRDDWRNRNRRHCCANWPWQIIFLRVFLFVVTFTMFVFLGRLFVAK